MLKFHSYNCYLPSSMAAVAVLNRYKAHKHHECMTHLFLLLFYLLIVSQRFSLVSGVRQVEKVDESYRNFLEKLLDEKFYNRRIRPFYSDNSSKKYLYDSYIKDILSILKHERDRSVNIFSPIHSNALLRSFSNGFVHF